MLSKRLCSVFRKHFPRYLSTAPSPKIENELPEHIESRDKNEVLQNPDYFKVHTLFTVKDLFKAKVHYGHKEATLHQNMTPFVFGTRLGHVIFDLDVTACHLREALNFTAHIAYRDGVILFVSKNPRATLLVERTAQSCKEFALTREFHMGLFTDSDKKFGTYIRLPDLVILLNTLEENGSQHQIIAESAKMCIPTIGIVDSNCNPNLITYPVPGNDDSYSCFELYCKLFEQAILRGKTERERNERKNSESVTNVETKEEVKRSEVKGVTNIEAKEDVKESEVKGTMNVVSSNKSDSSVKSDVKAQ